MTWFTSCSFPEVPLSKVHARVSFSAEAGGVHNTTTAPITPAMILIRNVKLGPCPSWSCCRRAILFLGPAQDFIGGHRIKARPLGRRRLSAEERDAGG